MKANSGSGGEKKNQNVCCEERKLGGKDRLLSQNGAFE
jgi:hypothetical protein